MICSECKKTSDPCLFVTKFRSSRTKTQEKAHSILCKNCPCVDPKNGSCRRIIGRGCPNGIPNESTEILEDQST